jgi:hypothetical protein
VSPLPQQLIKQSWHSNIPVTTTTNKTNVDTLVTILSLSEILLCTLPHYIYISYQWQAFIHPKFLRVSSYKNIIALWPYILPPNPFIVCLSTYMFMFVHLSVSLSFCISNLYMSTYLPTHPPTYLSIFMSLSLCNFMSSLRFSRSWLWRVTSYGMWRRCVVEVQRPFGETYCFHLQDLRVSLAIGKHPLLNKYYPF